MNPVTYTQAILIIGASFELMREESGYSAVAKFHDVTEEKDHVVGSVGSRRSEAIGVALEKLGFSDAKARLLNCCEWRAMASILDGERFDRYALSLLCEPGGAYRVTLVCGDERFSAAGDTPLKAVEIAAGEKPLKVPEAFANNEPVPERILQPASDTQLATT